jgi:NAD-dependent deacetylase
MDAEKTVALTGAGISTPSGIPDFRSAESGLWEHIDEFEVASLAGFRRNPQGFYDWVRPLIETILAARPNPAHEALAQMETRGHLQCVVTQNIDGLHGKAGNLTVYEVHGHLRKATCTHCFRVYDGESITHEVLKTGNVPRCDDCGGVIKPNVILFGEQLPIQILQVAQRAVRDCDVMLVIGSSLEVIPASDLAVLAKRHGAKVVIINLSETALDSVADMVLHGDAAHILPDIIHCLDTLSL